MIDIALLGCGILHECYSNTSPYCPLRHVGNDTVMIHLHITVPSNVTDIALLGCSITQV